MTVLGPGQLARLPSPNPTYELESTQEYHAGELGLIDTDFEINTDDEDAAIERALETSGYLAAREQLFPL